MGPSAVRKWSDLAPDPDMVAALDAAEGAMPRAVAVAGGRPQRHKWSNAFADACARMLATRFREHRTFASLEVLPATEGSAEPRTFVAGDKKKQIDVVVSSLVSGLQVGVSLKGMNFRDSGGMQFDKNLTGRTYELQDEVRVVHEYQPAAFMIGLYFLPIAATVDKKSEASTSSFARTVQHLRARTGRLDPTLPSHHSRLDLGVVCLYVPGDEEGGIGYRDGLPRGVVRYFDVRRNPPRRGRPIIDSTLDLVGLVQLVADEYAPDAGRVEWAEPERD